VNRIIPDERTALRDLMAMALREPRDPQNANGRNFRKWHRAAVPTARSMWQVSRAKLTSSHSRGKNRVPWQSARSCDSWTRVIDFGADSALQGGWDSDKISGGANER
jgi:hypothetical protein